MGFKPVESTAGVLAGLVLISAPAVWAGPPTQQVRSTVDGIHTIFLDVQRQPEAKQKQRWNQLKQLVARRFDFTEMAKRALGPQWERRSQRERSEYVKVFADVVETSYLDRMEAYAGEQVVYLREEREDDYAEVATKALAVKGPDLGINYKLKRARGGDWKVYDLVIDNVSLVNNYRAQFARILHGGSFDVVLKRLRETRSHQIETKKSRPNPTLLSAWLLAQASGNGNRPR